MLLLPCTDLYSYLRDNTVRVGEIYICSAVAKYCTGYRSLQLSWERLELTIAFDNAIDNSNNFQDSINSKKVSSCSIYIIYLSSELLKHLQRVSIIDTRCNVQFMFQGTLLAHNISLTIQYVMEKYIFVLLSQNIVPGTDLYSYLGSG